MKKLIFILLFFGCISICKSQYTISLSTIYSQFVKDSFELYFDIPSGYKVDSTRYSVVFYMDSRRASGNDIRDRLLLDAAQKNMHNVLFVGVGHIGDYKKFRPRDFIPPILKNGKTIQGKNPYLGHADKFYQFLTVELIPFIKKKYPNNGRYTYIGHSYGGLFGFYCLFQPKPVFTNYIILSPSLWANCNNFFSREKDFYSRQQKLWANVYHACGTAEWGNFILPTSRRMRTILEKRKYEGLVYVYKEFKGKTHMSMLVPALEEFFKEVKF